MSFRTLISPELRRTFATSILAIATLTACGGKSSTSPDARSSEPADASVETDAGFTGLALSGQVTDIDTGLAISGVNVETPDGTSTTTDADGLYSLALSTPAAGFALKLSKDGFAPSYERVPGAMTELVVDGKLIAVDVREEVDASLGGTVRTANGTQIVFPGSALTNADGTAYTGMATIELTHIDPLDDDKTEAFPGSFEAIQSDGSEAILISHSLADITATDANGELLQIASGTTATLHLPLSAPELAPSTIGLWSLSPELGVWIEEGVATKSVVGGQAVYVAEISHLSWWNADFATNVATLTTSYELDGVAMTAEEIAQRRDLRLRASHQLNGALYDKSLNRNVSPVPTGVPLTVWVESTTTNVGSQSHLFTASANQQLTHTFNIVTLPAAETPPEGAASCGLRRRYCVDGCLDVALSCNTVGPADYCTVDNGGCGELDCAMADGRRSCDCGDGFVELDGACQDIDECTTYENGGCDPLAICTNTVGARECACPAGYAGNGVDGCTDIDECATNNGGCDALATCTNTPGARVCGACPVGYNGTGEIGCSDIDECATNNGGCDPLATCVNSPGSRTCGACPAGYSGTGATSCTELDECTLGTDDCVAESTCQNLAGSYSCDCPTDYIGDGTNAGSGCATCVDHASESICSTNPACAWDPSTVDCIESSDICSTLTFENACTASGCVWDGTSCLNDCPTLTEQGPCEAQGCLWDDMILMCTGDCSANTDQFACEGAAGCFWDGFSCGAF